MSSRSRSRDGATVASVERAFSILFTMASGEASMGVSDIARETRLAKSTVSRLLGTLEGLGVVDRDDDAGRYRLGPGLSVFNPDAIPSLIDLARPHLRDLVDELGEDAGLAVSDGYEVLYIDQVGGPEPVQVLDWTGSRHAPHTVAAGYVLMRGWPTEKLSDYLARPLLSATADTDTSPESVARRVAQWVDHVWTYREFAEDVHGVASPILGPSGQIVAAVNLYGPSYRFPGERSPEEIGERLAQAGERITRLLSRTYV